jgi:solute carrier family 25 folate transporter 32
VQGRVSVYLWSTQNVRYYYGGKKSGVKWRERTQAKGNTKSTMTMTMADASTAAKPTSAQQCSQQKPSSATSSPMSSFLAGIAGGSASTILLYPLDLIKVRMQVDERPRYSAPNGTAAAAAAAHHEHPTSNSIDKPRTICTTVRGVIRHEGYVGLYRGLSPAIVGSAASWGGFFILYEEIKKQMLILKNNASSNSPLSISSGMNISINATISPEAQMQQPRLGPIDHFAASCLAGACMVALTNPLWLIKTRLQLQNSRLQNQISSPQNEASRKVKPAYRGMFHAAYTIVQEEGVLALYKGSVPALMLVSHGGIQFVTYEFLKGHFTTLMSNGKERRENELQRRQLTIGERLQDSLGYLVMGAMSKL